MYALFVFQSICLEKKEKKTTNMDVDIEQVNKRRHHRLYSSMFRPSRQEYFSSH